MKGVSDLQQGREVASSLHAPSKKHVVGGKKKKSKDREREEVEIAPSARVTPTVSFKNKKHNSHPALHWFHC